jgi:hypothetical protein
MSTPVWQLEWEARPWGFDEAEGAVTRGYFKDVSGWHGHVEKARANGVFNRLGTLEGRPDPDPSLADAAEIAWESPARRTFDLAMRAGMVHFEQNGDTIFQAPRADFEKLLRSIVETDGVDGEN